jgi:hypothetical protein
MRLDEKRGSVGTAPAAPDQAPQQTVWRHDDAAIRQWGNNPPESHWSRQNTQPLGPRWPSQLRGRRAALVAGRESRAMRRGAGLGALLTGIALGLMVLLAAANGWLPGSSPTSPDSAPPTAPAQSMPHSTNPAATSLPTSTALPTATAQPTATTWPTPTTAPTATTQPAPTVTPLPRPTPVPKWPPSP